MDFALWAAQRRSARCSRNSAAGAALGVAVGSHARWVSSLAGADRNGAGRTRTARRGTSTGFFPGPPSTTVTCATALATRAAVNPDTSTRQASISLSHRVRARAGRTM